MLKMHQPTKKWRILERNMQNKFLKQRRSLLDQKPTPTKSQYGMEPNICNGGRRGTKNDTKLESFWKQIFGLSNLQQQILI